MTLYEPPPEQPRDPPEEESAFSLPQALVHAAVAGAVVFLAGFAVSALLLGAEPSRAAEALGRVALVAAFLALLWSIGTQLGNASLSAAGGLGVIAVLVFVLVEPVLSLARFSAPERAVPFSLEDGRLCQPALDVVFPRPGRAIRLQRDPPEELRWSPVRESHAWVYRDPDGESVVFLVSKVGGGGEEAFRSFVRAFEERAGDGELVGRRLRWRDGTGDYRFGWTGADGLAHDVRCRASGPRPDGRPPLVACLLTTAADHQALAAVRRGLAFAECGGA